MNALAERWQRLARREQVLVVGLAIAGVALGLYRGVFVSQAQRLRKARGEWLSVRQQVAVAKAARPDLDRQRAELEMQGKAIEEVQSALEQMEQGLVTTADLSRVLAELTRQVEGLRVTLESVKQHVSDDPDDARVSIDVVFVAPYEDLVNYLRRIERLSPYLRIGRLEVVEPKDRSRPGVEGRMTLVSLLRQSSEGGGLVAGGAVAQVNLVALRRNPFSARTAAAQAAYLKHLKVTGITAGGSMNTAIINDAVVRVGDLVDKFTVKEILPDRVILSDGKESHTLSLER